MVYTNLVDRSWDKLYTVVRGTKLLFYKDGKSAKSAPEVYAKGEAPLDLRGGSCEVAADYTKKKHVFRVKYVFQRKKFNQFHSFYKNQNIS